VIISLYNINPLTPNELKRRRAVSPLKIKIRSKKISAGSVARRFNSRIEGLNVNQDGEAIRKAQTVEIQFTVIWGAQNVTR
jgi:hypothetical protein